MSRAISCSGYCCGRLHRLRLHRRFHLAVQRQQRADDSELRHAGAGASQFVRRRSGVIDMAVEIPVTGQVTATVMVNLRQGAPSVKAGGKGRCFPMFRSRCKPSRSATRCKATRTGTKQQGIRMPGPPTASCCWRGCWMTNSRRFGVPAKFTAASSSAAARRP